MKKFLSILCFTILLMGLGTSAYASEEKEPVSIDEEEFNKIINAIEKTNRDIDKKIEKAVEKADKIYNNYLSRIRQIEEGKKVIKLKNEREKAFVELENVEDDKKAAKIRERILIIDNKIEREQQKIDDQISEMQEEINETLAQLLANEDKKISKIEKRLAKLNEKLNERFTQSEESTQAFTNDLEKTITDVYNETLEMSANTIAKARERGVIAECSWKLVRFANRWEWIDPVRVIGFSRS